jgi:hypothetical protein
MFKVLFRAVKKGYFIINIKITFFINLNIKKYFRTARLKVFNFKNKVKILSWFNLTSAVLIYYKIYFKNR